MIKMKFIAAAMLACSLFFAMNATAEEKKWDQNNNRNWNWQQEQDHSKHRHHQRNHNDWDRDWDWNRDRDWDRGHGWGWAWGHDNWRDDWYACRDRCERLDWPYRCYELCDRRWDRDGLSRNELELLERLLDELFD